MRAVDFGNMRLSVNLRSWVIEDGHHVIWEAACENVRMAKHRNGLRGISRSHGFVIPPQDCDRQTWQMA